MYTHTHTQQHTYRDQLKNESMASTPSSEHGRSTSACQCARVLVARSHEGYQRSAATHSDTPPAATSHTCPSRAVSSCAYACACVHDEVHCGDVVALQRLRSHVFLCTCFIRWQADSYQRVCVCVCVCIFVASAHLGNVVHVVWLCLCMYMCECTCACMYSWPQRTCVMRFSWCT
jgi:hypothetical protein